MESKDYIIVDKIKWWVSKNLDGTNRFPVPLCPIDHLRLDPITSMVKTGNALSLKVPEGMANVLKCPECGKQYQLPRNLNAERTFIINKVDALFFKNQKYIDLDNVALPIAKANFKSSDKKYSANIQVMESKRGLQIVVYAGKKGYKNAQIFIEPEIKKMSFDHSDTHPDEIFAEITAKFKDGSTHTIKNDDKK